MTKICTKCGIEKNIYEFYIKDKTTGRRDSKCKTCVSGDRQTYYQNNKESVAETHRKWYEENKPKVLSDVLQWQRENPDKRRKYARNATARLRETNPDKLTERNKRKEKNLLSNPANKMAKNLRGRLRGVLKGRIRNGSGVKDLGCSLEDFKLHIESLWKENMSWDNYGQGLGKWSLDHIIPLTAFNLVDRQHVVLACHYLNLQPLWHEENSSKGNKLGFEFRRVGRTISEPEFNTQCCSV